MGMAGTSFESIGLILTAFLTGLTASFTHCIGMCGPIAIGQMSMRLMHLPKEKNTEWNRFKCALSIPYYLGKAITYMCLMLVAMSISQSFRSLPYIKWLSIILLFVTALFFIKSGITRTFAFLDIKLPFIKSINNLFVNMISRLKLTPFGLGGMVMGMALGLIPCGIVYASIITIISHTSSYAVAALSMFMFGFATIPGLFIVAYLGKALTSRNNALFQALYTSMMFVNTYLLISYGLKLIQD
jgi:sulfite exporter TauE/SafE